MKQDRHSLMAKGIMVLLTLLILVFIFTFAWFIDADAPVTANGLSLKTESSADFEMAIGFTTPELGNKYWISEFATQSNKKIDFEKINVPAELTLGSRSGTVTTITNTGRSGNTPVNMMADFKPIDLTGDGVTLYRPEMTSKNRSIDFAATSMENISGNKYEDNKKYITFDLYVRSTKPDFRVSLSKGSYVVAAGEASTTTDVAQLATEVAAGTVTPNVTQIAASDGNYTRLKGDNAVRKSKYGAFSEDSVVGATRVSFTQYNLTSASLTDFFTGNVGELNANQSLLWIPRNDIYLQDTKNTDDWTLHTAKDSDWSSASVDFLKDSQNNYIDIMHDVLCPGGNGRSTVTYQDAASEHWYYNNSEINNATVANRFSKKNAITDITKAANTVIINASKYNNTPISDGTYYYGKCRINLWIEGCDAEARRAIDGGSFFYGFDLTAN